MSNYELHYFEIDRALRELKLTRQDLSVAIWSLGIQRVRLAFDSGQWISRMQEKMHSMSGKISQEAENIDCLCRMLERVKHETVCAEAKVMIKEGVASFRDILDVLFPFNHSYDRGEPGWGLLQGAVISPISSVLLPGKFQSGNLVDFISNSSINKIGGNTDEGIPNWNTSKDWNGSWGKDDTFHKDWGNGASVSSDLLGADASGEAYVKLDPANGEVGVGVRGDAEAYIYNGSAEYTSDYLNASAGLTVGSIGAQGAASSSLFKDGKFDPSVDLSASAEAKGLEGTVEAKLGNDQVNAHVNATGTVGKADAGVSAHVGTDGISTKAEVGAAVFHGEAEAGFSLFGYSINLTGEAEALSVGAGFEFHATADSVEVGGKLSALLGFGGKLSIKKESD